MGVEKCMCIYLRLYKLWYSMSMNICLFCKKPISKNSQKYCSNNCQKDYEYKNYIKSWRLNKDFGKRTVNISKHIKRYLLDKYKGKCVSCGWSKRHPLTNKVPLEVDHINGNAHDNFEDNLRLLCPNCHSLTNNFRNLNRGKGRKWRSEASERTKR